MERISVCVRARGGNNSVVDVGPSVVRVNGMDYKVDRAFESSASQVDVYDSLARKVIEGITTGLNGTIFAYGQTGSGKTHTMVGPSALSGLSLMEHEDLGIIPRAINDLFNLLLAKQNELTKERFRYEMTIHYIQLYKEEWFDLLDSNNKLLFRSAAGINAKRIVVTSTEEALELLAVGWSARRTAETAMNRTSSRSHCVFVVELTTEELVDDLWQCLTSKLCLVDLAGSERVAQTGVEVGSTQFKEGIAINTSLSTLSKVIRQLSEKAAVVSYRDSQLTHYLKDSLGGNARTSIVVTIHSGKSYLTNIISSLQFAQCCRTIKNNLQINMSITGETVMALSNKVNLLNQQLQQGLLEARIDAEVRIEELQDELVISKQSVANKDAEIDSLKTKLQFEAERFAIQTSRAQDISNTASPSTKRRRKTIWASADEVHRSMQRCLDFVEDEDQNTREHVPFAEQMAFIDDDEYKENDLEVPDNCLRQLVEDKNREILELRDQIHKWQVEAKDQFDELSIRCDDLQRKNNCFETALHGEKEQIVSLAKEKENIQLQYGDLKSVNIQLEEKCKILEANNIKLEEKAEQEREEFEQQLIRNKTQYESHTKELKDKYESEVAMLDKEKKALNSKLLEQKKDFQSQITALEEKHRSMLTSPNTSKERLDLDLSLKKDKLEDLHENLRVKQEREKNEAALNKKKELSQQQMLQLKELHRSQTEDLRKKHQAELENLKQRQAYANQRHEKSIQCLEKEFNYIKTNYEEEHKKRQSLDVQVSGLEAELRKALLRNQALEEQIRQYEARLMDLEQSGSRRRLASIEFEESIQRLQKEFGKITPLKEKPWDLVNSLNAAEGLFDFELSQKAKKPKATCSLSSIKKSRNKVKAIPGTCHECKGRLGDDDYYYRCIVTRCPILAHVKCGIRQERTLASGQWECFEHSDKGSRKKQKVIE